MKVVFIGSNSEIADTAGLSLRLCWPNATAHLAATAGEGLEFVEETSPDIVLLDSSLPDMSLANAIQELRRISNVLLLVLGHQGDENEIATALHCGADDYVILPCDMTELMARISFLLRRAGPMFLPDDGTPISISSLVLNPATKQVLIGKRTVTLTPSQFRLLNRILIAPDPEPLDEGFEHVPGLKQRDHSGTVELYARQFEEMDSRTIQESAAPEWEFRPGKSILQV